MCYLAASSPSRAVLFWKKVCQGRCSLSRGRHEAAGTRSSQSGLPSEYETAETKQGEKLIFQDIFCHIRRLELPEQDVKKGFIFFLPQRKWENMLVWTWNKSVKNTNEWRQKFERIIVLWSKTDVFVRQVWVDCDSIFSCFYWYQHYKNFKK